MPYKPPRALSMVWSLLEQQERLSSCVLHHPALNRVPDCAVWDNPTTTVETYDKKSYDNKSRLSILDLWTPESNMFDLNIGFHIQEAAGSKPPPPGGYGMVCISRVPWLPAGCCLLVAAGCWAAGPAPPPACCCLLLLEQMKKQ